MFSALGKGLMRGAATSQSLAPAKKVAQTASANVGRTGLGAVPNASQRRQIWTQDVALGLNNSSFYKAAAQLEAATESIIEGDNLGKDQPSELSRTKPWVLFGHHSGQYMKTDTSDFVFGKLTPADGEPPFVDVIIDVTQSVKDNNGIVYASFSGWSAETHFGELASMARDKSEDYVDVMKTLPLNTMLSIDSVDQKNLLNASIGIIINDDEVRPKDHETWGLSQKPSITTVEYAHLFEGQGREDTNRLSLLDQSGRPLNKQRFFELYDKAAHEVRKSPNGIHTFGAKDAMSKLQQYVDKGEEKPVAQSLQTQLKEASPYFKAWGDLGPESYKRNFEQATMKMDTYYQDLKEGEALAFTLEVPKAYGNVTHIMGGLLVKPENGGDPQLRLAHHESAPINTAQATDKDSSAQKKMDWKDGAMTNIVGAPTNNHDTRGLFEKGSQPPLERTPKLTCSLAVAVASYEPRRAFTSVCTKMWEG